PVDVLMRTFSVAFALLAAMSAFAQAPRPPDRYQTALDRLDAMASVGLPVWRYHDADLPHPEDPLLEDATWTAATLTAANAPGWYRRWIEIPPRAGGRETRGARVDLVLRLSGTSRVFVNGSLVAQGNGRRVQPIQLAAGASPAQRLLVAVQTNRLSDARLSIHYDGVDPSSLRSEILTAEALLAGFPEPGRQGQLDAAVRTIDF